MKDITGWWMKSKISTQIHLKSFSYLPTVHEENVVEKHWFNE